MKKLIIVIFFLILGILFASIEQLKQQKQIDKSKEIEVLQKEVETLKSQQFLSFEKPQVIEKVVEKNVKVPSLESKTIQEDPLIQIERCKNEARIASENRRLKNAVGIELLHCLSNSGCNYQNTKSFLDSLIENERKSSYDTTYNWCLTSNKEEFETLNRLIENYWQQCETRYPGEPSLKLYNQRQECVTSLLKN